VLYVRRPGRTTYSYVKACTLGSTAAWSYRYTFSRTATRGYYYFKALFAAAPALLGSTSRIVKVRVR
jgi:hypothetical protein